VTCLRSERSQVQILPGASQSPCKAPSFCKRSVGRWVLPGVTRAAGLGLRGRERDADPGRADFVLSANDYVIDAGALEYLLYAIQVQPDLLNCLAFGRWRKRWCCTTGLSS
jgi:hypothetical protein